MTACRREDSDRFLAGLLDPVDESQFTEHLNHCPKCRHWLEESAGSDADWQSARELLACSCSGSDSQVAARESGAGVEDSHSLGPAETLDLTRLTFLAPTDDPSMVGRVGPYEISALLGRGATGIVLKGFDRALSRNVAIKVLDPAIAGIGTARQRFAREARAMAAISHEHVVPVYGVDEHAGLPYFVMEYVAGGALERRLTAEGGFDVVSVVRIGLQTAQALAAAHAQGLVHRDIKPGNILIDRGTERIRVADFGLARVSNDVSSTRSGFLAGTPQYMAPEQVRGDACEPQSDLFSLGAVMYVLCTGHVPFRAESVYGVMQRILHDPPRSIREQNPQIPAWLEEFIFRLLAKERRERFASADEVVRLLQEELACLQNPAAVAEPPREWIRRSAGAASSTGRRRMRLALSLVAFGGLSAATAVWLSLKPDGTAKRGSPSTDNASQPAAGAPDEVSSAATSLPVSLWNSDNLRETQRRTSALESAWQSPTTETGPDLWLQQTADVRRRLAELSRDLDAPPRASGAGSTTPALETAPP